jgi:hypothetical protein
LEYLSVTALIKVFLDNRLVACMRVCSDSLRGCAGPVAAGQQAVAISVLIDDQDLVRKVCRCCWRPSRTCASPTETGNGSQALAQARWLDLDPDVVLIDVRMREVDGAEATAKLVAGCCRARILMLTNLQP